MTWFKDITTEEQGLARYYQLAKEYHPDRGGDPDAFRQIEREWSDLKTYFRIASQRVLPVPPAPPPKPRKARKSPQKHPREEGGVSKVVPSRKDITSTLLDVVTGHARNALADGLEILAHEIRKK